MSWDELTEVDKAWIAGIFEGEGSVAVYRGAGQVRKYIRILIYNNDITMLKEIQRLIGGNLHDHMHRKEGQWAQSHQLQFGKKSDVQNFKEHIYPYMRTKYKKQQLNKCFILAKTNGCEY